MPPVSNATTAAYDVQVDDLVSVLGNDSKASTSDKANAYKSLQGLLSSSVLYTSGAKDALAKAYDLSTNSDYAKKVETLNSQYGAMGASIGRGQQGRNDDAPNAAQIQLDLINKFSDDDQQVLFAGMGFNRQYSDLESYKASLQDSAADFAAKQAAATPVVQVSLSDQAKAALANGTPPKAGAETSDTPKTADEQALATLKAGAADVSKGSVALTILQQAADARAATKADDDKKDKKAADAAAAKPTAADKKPGPYMAGDVLDEIA